MRLRGRLTGHFLGRVALMLAGLGLVFLVWAVALTIAVSQANKGGIGAAAVLTDAAGTLTVKGKGAVLPTETIAAAQRGGYWIQVLDENGYEIAQAGRPAKIPRHYTPGMLVLYRQSPGSNGLGQRSISTWVDTIQGRELTLVLGEPGTQPQGPATLINRATESPSPRTILLLSVALLVGGGIVTIGVAWLFGRGLAKPLVHMMAWLSALARGEYSEPQGRKGRPVSRKSNGVSLRRPYATYREVFASLDTLTAQMRTNSDERARIEAARDEWVAGVSHDLRTPLTSIRGYAEVLASDYEFESGEVRRQAAVIATQAGHMDELLEDLNLSFRLRADALALSRSPLDLVELAREAAVALANDPRAAHTQVLFDEPPGSGAITVSGDQTLLRRAMANLLVNAAVHNPDGTTVRVTVAREGSWALLRVSDDGAGMDEATRLRLFDRYFRGTSTVVDATGTGLGMAITRQIVVAHGGAIHVASTPGHGTIVQVALPSQPS
ncbi:MAG TPA: HAMP domain-containing sensor histidine kinase [Coriobacteriia bacterium]